MPDASAAHPLRNPYERHGSHHRGNKMALANIRERLALALRRLRRPSKCAGA